MTKKKKEILKNDRILEVKAKDSVRLDLETRGRAESTMAGDSEKVDLESATLKISKSESRRFQNHKIQNLKGKEKPLWLLQNLAIKSCK